MKDKIYEWLRTLKESDLYIILQDLLRVLGYERIMITHGHAEMGRDLIFYQKDPIGRGIWRGIQVKKEHITGSLTKDTGARAIWNQLEAALDTPYVDINGETINLSEIWLITPYPINESTKQSIIGKLRFKQNIHIIDGSTLCDLLGKHFPDLIRSGSKPVEDYLDNLITYCNTPEEYISLKMKIHYSISDIFINPLAAIDVTFPTSVSKLDSIDKILDMDEVLDDLKYVIPLWNLKILPIKMFTKYRDKFIQIKYLSQAINSICRDKNIVDPLAG